MILIFLLKNKKEKNTRGRRRSWESTADPHLAWLIRGGLDKDSGRQRDKEQRHVVPAMLAMTWVDGRGDRAELFKISMVRSPRPCLRHVERRGKKQDFEFGNVSLNIGYTRGLPIRDNG